jgi:hypothetical protein
MEVVLHKNDIKLPPITIEALQNAISLIQDYQKLRGRIDKDKFEHLVNLFVAKLSCSQKYFELDEQEDLTDKIITYLQQPTEPKER